MFGMFYFGQPYFADGPTSAAIVVVVPAPDVCQPTLVTLGASLYSVSIGASRYTASIDPSETTADITCP